MPSRDHFLGKLLRYPLTLLPPDTVVPILSGPLRGSRWIYGSSVHSCWLGTYELSKLKLVSKFLKPGQVMYDVGANVGLYSLLGSQIVGAQGHIFAFEPSPRNCAKLREHMDLNKVNNYQLLESAVSDGDGIRSFDTANGPLMGRLSESGTTTVRVLELDTFWRADTRLRTPQFIKIDVEGAEMQVLRGAAALLDACAPGLFVATHGEGLQRECQEFLTSIGYVVEQIELNELVAKKGRISQE